MILSNAGQPSTERLIILLGAGASVEAGIPHVVGFVRAFEEWLRLNYGRKHPVPLCYEEIKRCWNTLPGWDSVLHLERLYELLHFINCPPGGDPIPRVLASAFPRRNRTTELLYWDLTAFIHARCLNVQMDRMKYLRPLAAFAREFKALTILTLNYDACVERIFDSQGVQWTDGFSETSERIYPSFSPASSVNAVVRIVKLHGSVTWYRRQGGVIRKPSVSQEAIARAFNVAQSMADSASMVFPIMNKGLANGPFPKLVSEAQQALSTSSLCLAIGYGFNDRHILQMVVEGLRVNNRLKIALVNPSPGIPLRLLYEAAGDVELQKRIGYIDPDPTYFRNVSRKQFLASMLCKNRLLETTRSIIAGGSGLVSPNRFDGNTVRSFLVAKGVKGSGSAWKLKYPFPNGAGHMHLNDGILRVISGDRIFAIDLGTEEQNLIADEFRHPGCMEYDAKKDVLYVVETRYRPYGKEIIPSIIRDRFGLGRLWVKQSESLAAPFTGLTITSTRLAAIERDLKRDLFYNREWKARLKGVLRYATAVFHDSKQDALLLAQAGSGLWRLRLGDGVYELAVPIPECMNLVGVHRYSKDKALLVDGGVHPSGFGRLMKCNLATGLVTVMAGGWSQIGGVAYDRGRKIILISQGYHWPEGRVFALDANNPRKSAIREWTGLNRPQYISCDKVSGAIFVSTKDGICELQGV